MNEGESREEKKGKSAQSDLTVLKRSKLGIRLLYLITFLQLCGPQKREQARRHKHCLRKPKNNYAINPIYLHYESKCLLSKHKLKDERNFFRSVPRGVEGHMLASRLLREPRFIWDFHLKFYLSILGLTSRVETERDFMETQMNCIVMVIVVVEGTIPSSINVTQQTDCAMCGRTINWLCERRKIFLRPN